MVRYKLKKLALACVLGVQLVTVTACGGKSTSSGSQATVNQETADQGTNTTDNASSDASSKNTNVIYGQVTAVNGSDVTISVGTLNQNAGPQGGPGGGSQDEKGGQPQGGPQSGDTNGPGKSGSQDQQGGPGGGNSQDKPSAPGDGNSQDQQSGDKSNRPSMLTLTGEEKTITISDESVIASNSSDSSSSGLSAITVGSTIAVTYADDGTTITKVEVMGMGHRGGGPSSDKTSDSTESN